MYNFPDTPLVNDTTSPPAGTLKWDGEKWAASVGGGGGGNFPEAPTDGRLYGRIGSAATWQPAVPLAGAVSMTGLLVLSGDPVAPLGAATKQLADSKLPLAGGTMTGVLTLAADPVGPLEPVTRQFAQAATTGFVAKSGDTMTGALQLPATSPLLATEATNKAYVDSLAAAKSLWQGTYAVASNVPDLTTAAVGDTYSWTATTVDPLVAEATIVALPGIPLGTLIDNGSLIQYSVGPPAKFFIIKGSGLTIVEGDARYVNVAGDAMTGALEIQKGNASGSPTTNYQIALRQSATSRPQWIVSTTDAGGGAGPTGESIQLFVNNHSGGAWPTNALFCGKFSNGQLVAPVGTPTAPGITFGSAASGGTQNDGFFIGGVGGGGACVARNGVQTLSFGGGAGNIPAGDSDSINVTNDGQGISLNGGGRFYKWAGGGIGIRKSSGNQQPFVEDYNGANRFDLMDARGPYPWTAGASYPAGVLVQYNNILFATKSALTAVPATPDFTTIKPYGYDAADYVESGITGAWATDNWVTICTIPGNGTYRVNVAGFGIGCDASVLLDVTTTYSGGSLSLAGFCANSSNSANAEFKTARLSGSVGGPYTLELQVGNAGGNQAAHVFVSGHSETGAGGAVAIPKPLLAKAGNVGGTQVALINLLNPGAGGLYVSKAGDAMTGNLTINSGGLSLGSTVAPTPQTLSNHIQMYGTNAYGFSITGGTLNYVVDTNAHTHRWWGGTTDYGHVDGTGWTLGTINGSTLITAYTSVSFQHNLNANAYWNGYTMALQHTNVGAASANLGMAGLAFYNYNTAANGGLRKHLIRLVNTADRIEAVGGDQQGYIDLGARAFTVVSKREFKRDLRDAEPGEAARAFAKLRPKRYRDLGWINPDKDYIRPPGADNLNWGLVIEDLVAEPETREMVSGGEVYSLNSVVGLLIARVKELETEMAALKARG